MAPALFVIDLLTFLCMMFDMYDMIGSRYPLAARCKVEGLEANGLVLVLHTFCCYCGHAGHETRAYNFQIADSVKREVKDEACGYWLQFEQGGRRMNEVKENSNPNVKIGEESYLNRPKKLIPVNFIKSLTSLSVNFGSKSRNDEEEEVMSSTPHPEVQQQPDKSCEDRTNTVPKLLILASNSKPN
ncbi:hypothetical protein PIB30_071011 [Stylosanthes scabra]|uniref:Uncharacterized protein n=1 Tax=Stylosanthes scabra TaxID=79078 RepID=A0ABU6TPH2_9FABA|nr:hypothetical protein [Stylosanthes scabra]